MSRALKAAVQAMVDLLTEENAALLAMDFARAGALLAPKHDAADKLASAWRNATTDETPQDDLVRLGYLAEENRKLLNRAMRVQRRVLELVARAARGTQSTSRYGTGGRVAARDTPRSLVTRA
jgi:hypothetical protein